MTIDSSQKALSTLRFNRKSSSSSDVGVEDDEILVDFKAISTGPRCPFGNQSVNITLHPGGCLWLRGNSGAGKTTLSTYLAGLSSLKSLNQLDIDCAKCEWNAKIPSSERCGVLFQQTTLLDALTVAGNVSVALSHCAANAQKYSSPQAKQQKIKQIMEAVGLDYGRDAAKRPTELSGGMARRASLALQLAQRKRVIVLDEPFAGLDLDTARSVAKELVHLRQDIGTALILISHEPELAEIVMAQKDSKHSASVQLSPLTTPPIETASHPSFLSGNNLFFGITFWDRFIEKLWDYTLYSLPLIVLTFMACGLAISMISADILQRIDVTDRVVSIVDQEIRPLIKMVTGEEEANPLYLMMARMKVKGMLNTTLPLAKANLYAIGLAKLFVLEIGPLLTALLLCGRIGGSYAGKVATMQATSQIKLLQTLGINSQTWTFWPAMAAAMFASPLLTAIGTWIALMLGAWVGPRYGIGSWEYYQEEVYQAIFPTLELQTALQKSWFAGIVEVSTYPPLFHLWKAVTFITIVLIVAEAIARIHPNLTPRGVPGVITSSVVIASLLVIVADWGFSQWWILRL